jgi:hypothetical protein
MVKMVKNTLKTISIEIYKTFEPSLMLTHSGYRYLFLISGTGKIYQNEAALVKKKHFKPFPYKSTKTFKLTPMLTNSDYRYLFLPSKVTLTMVHISGIGKIYQNESVLVKTIKRVNCFPIVVAIYTTFKLFPIATYSSHRYLFLPSKLTIFMITHISGVGKID